MPPFLFALILGLGAALPAGAAPELLDRIVAVIDNQVILWSEVNFRVLLELQERGYRQQPRPEELARLRQQALQQMVDENVLVLKARRDSLQVDESQVEAILGQRLQEIKTGMPAAEFASMLERAGLSERQLKTRYRKDIRHSLLADQLRGQLAMRLYVGRKELETYRQTYRDSLPPRLSLSKISVKLKPEPQVMERARTRIEEVRQKLQAGEPFADLARRYSEDPGSAANGGDLGCFKSGQLVPEFEEAARQLKPGQLSEPVITPYGYHLIELREKREEQLCASHILARAPMDQQDRERTDAQLGELRGRAQAGEDFAQLAREYSEDLPSAQRGGLWQILPKDQLPAFLLPHLAHLRLGEISAPFFLEDSGHLLKINDDQATIENLVREERLEAAMRRLIEDYRRQIHIEERLSEEFLHQPAPPQQSNPK
ncbi:MAG: peptidylprolyl isomerase [Candidatus Handelsmanbacteria bacterium]|nr:peptidylprolyl isomerase [Candidatus Handelsmanbacteria bacterium]